MKLVTCFKALADDTRLRLLNLLLQHELNVNEIVSIMGMGQSRISRHLKILSDSGLVSFRRDGQWVFYRGVDADQNNLMNQVAAIIHDDEALAHDRERYAIAIAERANEKNRFFDSLAPQWDSIKADLLGGLDLSAEIVKRIKSCPVAADLGCGTGELLVPLTAKAARVIGVDKSPNMIAAAAERLAGNGSIELRTGPVEHLPIRDRELQAAVINMVLHHLSAPAECILDASRVLARDGILVIVDLDKHQNEDMRRFYGHRWLGFSRDQVEAWLQRAGFKVMDISAYKILMGLQINLFTAVKEKDSTIL